MADTDAISYLIGGTDLVIEPPTQTIAILGEDSRTPLATIHADGTLEYGPGYTPDEAARCFWDALRRLVPARCEHCGHLPGHELT